MKKLMCLSAGLLLLLAGCSDEDVLLRSAEKQVKKYLDYPGSYRRIEWRITDTIFKSEMVLESLKEPLSIQEEKLAALSKKFPEIELRLKSKREDLAKCVDGKWVYPAPQQTVAKWQKTTMITVPEEEIRSELDAIIGDSAELAGAISKINFRKDSINNVIASLQRGLHKSEISQIRIEIRFRAKLKSDQQGTFMTKIMYLHGLNEFEILDTYYDGIRLGGRSE